jgi:nucleoside 2-deoxyribosyltransferase
MATVQPTPGRGLEVYVASPLGFDVAGRYYLRELLLPHLRSTGIVPLDPWDDPEDRIGAALGLTDASQRRPALIEANRVTGLRNDQLIRRSSGVLAMLDGSDVDSGTAAEIGFASALGRPIVGVRTDWRQSGDNEGTVVNLQIEWFIASSGGRITDSLESGTAALAAIMAARLEDPSLDIR